MISLTLAGGLLALPAMLLGLTLIARHPRSAHPLDGPAGLLAVLSIAATLGALLALIAG